MGERWRVNAIPMTTIKASRQANKLRVWSHDVTLAATFIQQLELCTKWVHCTRRVAIRVSHARQMVRPEIILNHYHWLSLMITIFICPTYRTTANTRSSFSRNDLRVLDSEDKTPLSFGHAWERLASKRLPMQKARFIDELVGMTAWTMEYFNTMVLLLSPLSRPVHGEWQVLPEPWITRIEVLALRKQDNGIETKVSRSTASQRSSLRSACILTNKRGPPCISMTQRSKFGTLNENLHTITRVKYLMVVTTYFKKTQSQFCYKSTSLVRVVSPWDTMARGDSIGWLACRTRLPRSPGKM